VYVLVLVPKDTSPEDSETPADRVERVWRSWTEMDVSPLAAEESREKGARLENLEDVKGLKCALGW